MSIWVALLAVVLERLAGYPQRLVDAIGHPVMWMGWLIGQGDRKLNRPELSFSIRKRRGILLLAGLVALVLAASLALAVALRALPFGWVIEGVLASSLLAQKGLRDAVCKVAQALSSEGILTARTAVSHIVGRDTTQLDEAEIARAAVETLAENASDGVVAPLFYLALFGLPGAAVYKAINTADSMIGHRSERHEAFGWAAARLDDVVNFIPARLTAFLFIIAAAVTKTADAARAYEAVRRDAKKHASLNAGWPESAMAGALGFGLGGPRAYQGVMIDLPRMGDGRRDLQAGDILAAVGLYDRMLWLVWRLLAAIATIVAIALN